MDESSTVNLSCPQKVYNTLLNKFWPNRCCLCLYTNSNNELICQTCRQGLPRLGTSCSNCSEITINDAICGNCLKNDPLPIKTTAAFQYQYPIDKILHQAKFYENTHLLKMLVCEAEALFESQIRETPFDVIVPVPLHAFRQIQRGYNQAGLIAAMFSRTFDLPVANDLVRRTKHTAAQSTLAAEDRAKNIKGAFIANTKAADKRILLVDDVVTTGSTTQEVGKCLLTSGVSYVEVFCLAKRSLG